MDVSMRNKRESVDNKIDLLWDKIEVLFDNPDNFAESVTVVGTDLYIPVNGTKCGLYRFFEKELDGEIVWVNQLIFEFEKGDVVIGSKIHNEIFIGCCTSKSVVIVYNFLTKCIFRIPVIGSPIDCCFIEESLDCLSKNCLSKNCLVISNVDYQPTQIFLINLDPIYDKKYLDQTANNMPNQSKHRVKCHMTRLFKNLKIYGGSGINHYQDKIYIGTLTCIYVGKLDGTLTKMSIDTNSKPFYDNIMIERNGKIIISIYDYDKKIYYWISKYPRLLGFCNMVFSFFMGCGYNDIYNSIKQNPSKIIYAVGSVDSDKLTEKQFPTEIPNFYKNVTHIVPYKKDLYVLINWSSDRFLITKLPQ